MDGSGDHPSSPRPMKAEDHFQRFEQMKVFCHFPDQKSVNYIPRPLYEWRAISERVRGFAPYPE